MIPERFAVAIWEVDDDDGNSSATFYEPLATVYHALSQNACQVLPYSEGNRVGQFVVDVSCSASAATIRAERNAELSEQDCAMAAFRRCIPFPYRTCQHLWPSILKAPREHQGKILFSFGEGSEISQNGMDGLLNIEAGPYLPKFSKAITAHADERLTKGRRGAWLIPVAGSMSIPFTSKAYWLAKGPSTASSGVFPRSPPPIQWTDARLKAVWSTLTRFHEPQRYDTGRVQAQYITQRAFTNPEKVFAEPSGVSGYIRVSCDGHVAMALRTLLGLIRVDQNSDSTCFLREAYLVYIDECGDPLLIATARS